MADDVNRAGAGIGERHPTHGTRRDGAAVAHRLGMAGRYQSANAALPTVSREPRVVLMGDSITEFWQQQMPEFFDAGHLS